MDNNTLLESKYKQAMAQLQGATDAIFGLLAEVESLRTRIKELETPTEKDSNPDLQPQ
jgi:hypothetical protein